MEFQVPVMVVTVILDQAGYLGRIRVFSQDHTILQEKKREDDLFADEKCITLIFITFRAKMINFHCKSKLSLLAL